MQDISNFNKDQLQAYLKNNKDGLKFVDLDMRKSLDKLRNEVKAMQDKPVKTADPAKPSATHIKNKDTGFVFPYTLMVEDHLGERGILCDEHGEAI